MSGDLAVALAIFLASAVVVIYLGNQLAKYGDALATLTGRRSPPSRPRSPRSIGSPGESSSRRRPPRHHLRRCSARSVKASRSTARSSR